MNAYVAVTFIDYIMLNWLIPWLLACLIVHFADITGLRLFTHLYKHVAHGEEQPTEAGFRSDSAILENCSQLAFRCQARATDKLPQ